MNLRLSTMTALLLAALMTAPTLIYGVYASEMTLLAVVSTDTQAEDEGDVYDEQEPGNPDDDQRYLEDDDYRGEEDTPEPDEPDEPAELPEEDPDLGDW